MNISISRILAFLFVPACFLVGVFPMAAKSDLGPLEAVLKNRAHYVAAKEGRIDSLKHLLEREKDVQHKLKLCDALYNEYLTFKYDSAIAYVDKAQKLLGDNADYDKISLIKIHRALSLATGGHFSEAIGLLRGIDSKLLSESTRREFYNTAQWAYGVWAEYSGASPFSEGYNKAGMAYLDSLLNCVKPGSADYFYFMAERALRHKDYDAARDNYEKAISLLRRNDVRLYAQIAYGLSMSYRALGDKHKTRKWLINAAISDQIIPLKENLALQELAMDIKNEDGNLETANRYLKYSLEDAQFYNNKLRMLEISAKIPDIVIGYQDTITGQNRRLKFYLSLIALLVLGLAGSIWVIRRQHKKVHLSRKALSELNQELKSLNAKLSEANSKLSDSNTQLSDANSKLTATNAKLAETNIWRERYMSLFMDLCAAYINKLTQFQLIVKTKLKVKQYDDLLRVVSNTRQSEVEMREMFFNFDTAFLKLYPNFISEFNELLQPDKSILPKQNELLNSDLRIFALIRMGIKDSNKIAALLFYSPQTIFNHRTQVRNRAKNRETFEKDLMKICSVVPE